MKKNCLINKYDFVNYFTKQPSLWFFSNTEIVSGIELETKFYESNDENEEDTNDDELIDYYELYKELLINNENIDINNPRMMEGNIIDTKSRDFIKTKFNYIHDVYDLDNCSDVNKYDLYGIAEKTRKLIESHKKIILFQPVFIHNNLVTKPDAIVKDEEEIILIETKGTTTAKLYHALDIYFQSQVLRSLEYLNDYYFDFKLCLIAYELANKHEVTFILSDTFNYTKTPSGLDKCNTIKEKQLCKIGMKPTNDEEECYIYLNSICNDSIDDFENKIEISKGNSKNKLIEVMNDFKYIFGCFFEIINELDSSLKKMMHNGLFMCQNINPHPKDKNKYKTNEFAMLRKLYISKGYDIFKYSGKLINFSAENMLKIKEGNYEILDFAISNKDALVNIINENNKRKIVINNSAYNLFKQLKSNKVYFDFETINSSIRSIDSTLPFMQIVTQCSIIIIDNATPLETAKCNNLFFDPTNIKISDYKLMVDSLYKGDNYSYVVYNKSFECSRLKEIKNMINDDEYSKKIDIIIANVFDLADFFMYKKDFQNIPVFIKELYGFYSIKKVLPFVEENYKNLYEYAKCKSYYDLDISNGLICQNTTMLHFLDPSKDINQWENSINNMKIYCENDVRAMIAVELFLNEILNN